MRKLIVEIDEDAEDFEIYSMIEGIEQSVGFVSEQIGF